MGWDLFGRVPYDDWLFSTSRLIRPDLLRRSYVEAVSDDIYGDNGDAIDVVMIAMVVMITIMRMLRIMLIILMMVCDDDYVVASVTLTAYRSIHVDLTRASGSLLQFPAAEDD